MKHRTQLAIEKWNRTLFGLNSWCIALICSTGLCQGVAHSAEPGKTNYLKDAEIYGATVDAVKQRLAENERFVALPANVADIYGPPQGTPIFVILDQSQKRSPSEQPESYVEDHGSFRVVRYGTVLGASASEVVLLGSSELGRPGGTSSREVAIVAKDRVQHLSSPSYIPVTKAFQTDSGWGFVRATGIKLSSSPNLDELDLTNQHYAALVINDGKESVFLTRPKGLLYGEQKGPLVLTVKTPGSLKREEFEETGKLVFAQQGLVRLRDGGWLSIGTRLAVMDTNYPALPPEQKLLSVLTAAEAGDRPAYLKALQGVTEYSAEQLQGLVQLIGKVPDPFEDVRHLETSARDSMRIMENWQPRKGVPAQQQTQALAAVMVYRQAMETFLKQAQQIRNESLSTSPAMAGVLIRAGYQQFDGWWVGPPRLLRQEGLSSALLDMLFVTATNTVQHGIFRLNQEGRLEFLGEYGAVSSATHGQPFAPDPALGFFERLPSYTDPVYKLASALEEPKSPFHRPCEFVSSTESEILLFFPYQGLARVAGGRFEWVDRSDEFKRMERLVATDEAGRIYLAAAPALMSYSRSGSTFTSSRGGASSWAYPADRSEEKPDFWIYRRSATKSPSPIKLLFPIVSLPVMDSNERVWFLPLKPSARLALPQGAGALGDNQQTAAAVQKLESLYDTKPNPKPSGLRPLLSGEEDRAEWTTDLSYYDQGRVFIGTSSVLFNTILTAGSSGSIIGYSSDRKRGRAFLLDKAGITWATNLHELALTVYEKLFTAAPGQVRPSSVFVPNYDFSPDIHFPSIGQTAGYLWVNHQGRLEVYREGKPLNLQARLTLLNAPADMVMAGPLHTTNGEAMVILARRSKTNYGSDERMNVFWATPSTNSIELTRGLEKDFASSVKVPLVNLSKGKVYLPRFVSPPSYWVISSPDQAQEQVNQGVPIWVTGQGEVITRRSGSPFVGWRIYSDSSEWDCRISYERNLRVIAESEQGILVCRSPDGLVWLERRGEDYTVTREVRLRTGGFALSFVGETTNELFITVVDARQNAYLAVLDKP